MPSTAVCTATDLRKLINVGYEARHSSKEDVFYSEVSLKRTRGSASTCDHIVVEWSRTVQPVDNVRWDVHRP